MPRFVLIIFAGALLASLCVALLNVFAGLGKGPARVAGSDPQHVHRGQVPRTGGFALAIGVLAGVALADVRSGVDTHLLWILIAVSLPIFSVGIGEDVFGAVAPRWRYYASLASATLAFVVAEVRLERFDLTWFDPMLASMPISFAVTIFCVAGVAQAFNIVDGKNGLASGAALIAFVGIGMAALGFHDWPLLALAAACAGGVLGFMLLNVPRGLLFLGDGGAYLLGFFVAVQAVLLVQRHPEVSAWYPLMVCAYPVLETVLSFARRLVVERQRFDQPDHLHLHSLLYRALFLGLRRKLPLWMINSLTAVPILVVSALVAAAAFEFRFDSSALKLGGGLFVAAYLICYCMLRWARAQRRRRLTSGSSRA